MEFVQKCGISRRKFWVTEPLGIVGGKSEWKLKNFGEIDFKKSIEFKNFRKGGKNE
jgi:hypothetical protein